jgi:hypothetical protein
VHKSTKLSPVASQQNGATWKRKCGKNFQPKVALYKNIEEQVFLFLFLQNVLD